MYAVVDVETTGLRTGWHDRVLEVAVVHVDRHGDLTGEWCSLVNPGRDLGPQAIHGVSAAEARQAPTFDQLAGCVADLLRARVIVAHNLPFDVRFLRAEYQRMGLDAPIREDAGLCTMRLASYFLPPAGRSLSDCRRLAGLPAHTAHSALHDARAAAELLGYYLGVAGSPPPWAAVAARAAAACWPATPATTAAAVPRRSAGYRPRHFLTRLVDRLPRLDEPYVDAYLDLLDRALLDRHISESEADALVAVAEEYGLARADVDRVHRGYLAGLAAAALDDGVLTTAERHDLDQVAGLLGLDHGDVDKALAAADTSAGAGTDRQRRHLRPGDQVVFTGAMEPAREHWQAQARAAGLDVADNVTRQTHLLVAADPDSMSGKARKARRYGIPIVHLAGYRYLLDSLG